jgi:hypothetical protein
MHDSSKRNILKLLAATGASTVLPASLVTAEAAAGSSGASQFSASEIRTPDLYIDLIRSTAVPDDSVLLKNTSNETIVVKKFLPRTVVFDDVRIDLNAAAGGESLIIEPNQIVSLRTKAAPVQSDDVIEYVWANSAVQTISEDLTTVQLGAFMVNNQAIVYPLNLPTAQTPFPA